MVPAGPQAQRAGDGWVLAAGLVAAYRRRPGKAGDLLANLPADLEGPGRRRCQHLFYGVLRNLGRIDHALGRMAFKRPPRRRLEAFLSVAAYELLAASGAPGSGEGAAAPGRMAEPADQRSAPAVARVVDHAVGQARRHLSRGEAGMVNAVLRRLLPHLLEAGGPDPDADPAAGWPLRYSHPEWLVRCWISAFGEDATRRLLEWNQRPAVAYLRVFTAPAGGGGEGEDPAGAGGGCTAPPPPDGWQPTAWEGFFEVAGGGRGWETAGQRVAAGDACFMDPGSRLAPELLAAAPGERVLDLCSAPGGKARAILGSAGGAGAGGADDPTLQVVCVDLPGERLDRLRENLAPLGGRAPAVVGADLRSLLPGDLEARGLPGIYDAVLLDAPCSNTGVFRRRPDARWRLRPGDIPAAAALQAELLARAAAFVRPGGRLVYSTCSIEPEENRGVVDAFLAGPGGGRYTLHKEVVSLPWETGHDGGAAFLLVIGGIGT